MSKTLRVAVTGNPNVGKTSLFNVLTRSRHRVGNYPGVTVERRVGVLASQFAAGHPIEFIDLPGIYSLTTQSEDEAVAFRTLRGDAGESIDVILLVIDATNLPRNLYMALQVLEQGKPVVIALNMVDAAREIGLEVDADALGRELGVTVVPTVARTGEGAPELVAALDRQVARVEPSFVAPSVGHDTLREVLGALVPQWGEARGRWLITSAAAEHLREALASEDERRSVESIGVARCMRATEQLVECRYRRVDEILRTVGAVEPDPRRPPPISRSERIDRILTHRFWGLLVFLSVMAMVFISIFSWADPLMGAIEDGMGWVAQAVATALGPGMLTDLVVEGVIAGVGNVLVFIPQIAMLFLFVGLLEDSGYLARAAFLLDKLMARLGLHGRAFIPLLSGYACAIPAIMGTRTISSVKDRLVTILMIPFMSCSARLPVYTLVIGALFVTTDPWISRSVDRGLLLLSMYVLSTVSALFIGFLYKRTILRSPTPPLVLELPPYRMPRVRNTLVVTFDRVRDFVRNAGTVILAFTILLWGLLTFPVERTQPDGEGPKVIAESYGGRAARTLEPVLEPIGQDWRVGVGLIGSFAAREVLVSTLGLVYGMEAEDDDPVELQEAMRQDVDPQTGEPTHTPLTGLALMVFFVYACQCMSTLAVVRRETRSWKWPLFMLLSMTGIAYVAALLVYQGGRMLGFG